MCVIEFPFNKIVSVYSTAYYRLKKSTTDTFLELQAFKRNFENFGKCPGKTLSWSSFKQIASLKITASSLNSMFVRFWKIPEITCAVKFIFTEASAIRFFTRDLSTRF